MQTSHRGKGLGILPMEKFKAVRAMEISQSAGAAEDAAAAEAGAA